MLAHVFNPCTQEAEEFKDTLVYIEISRPARIAQRDLVSEKIRPLVCKNTQFIILSRKSRKGKGN